MKSIKARHPKYPLIPSETIIECLSALETKKFTTLDFIDLWKSSGDPLYLNFTGIGSGWRIMVGRNLSRFARDTKEIRMLDLRKDGAQMWENVGLKILATDTRKKDDRKKLEIRRKTEMLNFLHEKVFDPILESPRASKALKQGVRLTIVRLEERDAAGIDHFVKAAVIGTDKSLRFSELLAKQKFVRFEEVLVEFMRKFGEKPPGRK